MPVMQFGSHLASASLNTFKPIVGTTSYVSILDTQKVAAHEIFWIPRDIDTDTFGPIISESPLARKAFGNPSQTYSMPVFVHNAMNDPNGNLMVWKLSTTLYNQLLELSKQGDLSRYTICVTARKQGQGTRTEMSILPQPILRDYWTPEYKAKIQSSVDFWFEYCDSALYQTLSEPELITLLQNAGYDFQSNSFPNRIAQGSYFAKQAVGSVFNSGNQPQIQMQAPTGIIPPTTPVSPVPPTGMTIPGASVVTASPVPPVSGTGFIPQGTTLPVSPVSPVVQAEPMPNPQIPQTNFQAPIPPVEPGVTTVGNPNVVSQPQVSTMSQEDVNALFDDENL